MTEQQHQAFENQRGIYGERGMKVPNWLVERINATPDDLTLNPYCIGWVQSK